MQNAATRLIRFLGTLAVAGLLSSCGGSSEPDLEFRSLYNDSPLRLSIPLRQITLTWLPIVEEDDPLLEDFNFVDDEYQEFLNSGEYEEFIDSLGLVYTPAADPTTALRC